MAWALTQRADRISGTGLAWIGFYGLILAAWAALFAMAPEAPLPAAGGLADRGFWGALCGGAAQASPSLLFAMWALMSAAMMAPTMVPALRVYDDLGAAGATDRRGFAALVAGFLGVWVVFAMAGAVAQATLAERGLVAADGASRSLWLTAALLLGAGLYQFSPLKAGCLRRCRHPLAFFLERWRPGPAAALEMGARLGATCLGCCWALMLLGFVGGTMNLAWMGAATLFMTLEKLPGPGARLTGPAGLALLSAGGVTAAGACGLL